MTILRREEPVLYVSAWYSGAVLWTIPTYSMGNVMWHPGTGSESGIVDAIFLWLYRHKLAW